jgi:hypothetical protein
MEPLMGAVFALGLFIEKPNLKIVSPAFNKPVNSAAE